jgi:hypothetical protein
MMVSLPRQDSRGCFLAVAALLTVGLAFGQSTRAAEPVASAAKDRGKDEKTIAARCLSCHASDRKKGKLDLTRRALALAGGRSGPAITPGKADTSLLYQKLRTGEMPPQSALAAEEIAAFGRWIEAGAPYQLEPLTPAPGRADPDWWSLRPVGKPVPPAVRDIDWVQTGIDCFVLARLEREGLRPAPEADRATLLRRVTFDLIGLPPTPEELDAFLRDPAPDAYAKQVERLLASPHYGERWARYWLDIVRFAESHGYEMNTLRPNAWPYRDYVIRAFNVDLPYLRFIEEQLAGDALPDADGLTQAATGFLVGGAHDMVGNQTLDGMLQQRMDDLDDLVGTTAATFLGLTVHCARCHDHKFDPITQRDYYRLQAVFAGVQHAERELATGPSPEQTGEAAKVRTSLAQLEAQLDHFALPARPADHFLKRPPVESRRNVERFRAVPARFVRFTIAATNDGIEPCLDELEIYTAGETPRNVALASARARARASSVLAGSPLHRLEHLNDGRHGNAWSWIAAERGKGWVEVELPRVETIDRVVWGRDREGKFKDRLPVNYRIDIATEPGKWQTVASATDRLTYPPHAGSPSWTPAKNKTLHQLEEARARLESRLMALEPVRTVYAGTFSEPGATHLLIRGDPMRKGEAVCAGTPAAVRPCLSLSATVPERQRRLELARWLGAADNPLPARVLVNRIWQAHFGQGIVATPSDFGFNGERPSHPELLDWLAGEFIRSGWRLKPLHRQIVLSATYRQSGDVDPTSAAVDQRNRLLWRMSPRRLEAEAIRDAILAASGRLDQRMGGPGYSPWEKNDNYVVVFTPKQRLAPGDFRRMVYQFKPRSQPDPTFGVFDCPDGALTRPRRTVSTTALQALNLFNSNFTVEQAGCFAQRLRREVGEDPNRQADRGFRLALGRRPSAQEEAGARELIRTHGVAEFCRALLNANEFVYVD